MSKDVCCVRVRAFLDACVCSFSRTFRVLVKRLVVGSVRSIFACFAVLRRHNLQLCKSSAQLTELCKDTTTTPTKNAIT